ncbi:hypothetical protein BCR44DRAFT_1464298 [Catenaria anguillulae PL171]|uniref:Uncharacterized protein n=1 Tax=Catenaria anguillulae PL171 TaxID=765915 RepID=A0A1Y2H8H2_9FUNG|nr:hypothetical protein BCR44DRAFT_1464298 [Catenaria anguillulae PL171]
MSDDGKQKMPLLPFVESNPESLRQICDLINKIWVNSKSNQFNLTERMELQLLLSQVINGDSTAIEEVFDGNMLNILIPGDEAMWRALYMCLYHSRHLKPGQAMRCFIMEVLRKDPPVKKIYLLDNSSWQHGSP